MAAKRGVRPNHRSWEGWQCWCLILESTRSFQRFPFWHRLKWGFCFRYHNKENVGKMDTGDMALILSWWFAKVFVPMETEWFDLAISVHWAVQQAVSPPKITHWWMRRNQQALHECKLVLLLLKRLLLYLFIMCVSVSVCGCVCMCVLSTVPVWRTTFRSHFSSQTMWVPGGQAG